MSLDQNAASRGSEVSHRETSRWTASPSTATSPLDWRELSIRALDVTLTSIALFLLLPVFLLIAIMIRLDSKGPVLFIQKRVGRGGRLFSCYKFRSMRTDAEALRINLEAKNERSGPVFKMRNDPRITRVGKFLRRSSLDELPQLLNIMFGDMSLVGPRPAIPTEVAQYTARQLERLAVPPGLTGLWQVSGRASLSFERMIELDLCYVDERSVWTNIRIIALTIPAVVTGRGAY